MTITLTREEAQQVLDALTKFAMFDPQVAKAMTTLLARLSAPEPEPVSKWAPQVERMYSPEGVLLWERVKYTPDGEWQELPKQREWQGLTDEDRQELAAEQYGWEGLCSAVEAKLREKNA